jgi:hypothetical protein
MLHILLQILLLMFILWVMGGLVVYVWLKYRTPEDDRLTMRTLLLCGPFAQLAEVASMMMWIVSHTFPDDEDNDDKEGQ